jgi:hypothetical protein
MKTLTFTLFLGFFLFVSSLPAQNVKPTPVNNEDDVVKITTKLVQIDAVVTDKDGNQIKDLSIDDFELLQDGKPQKITDFSMSILKRPDALPHKIRLKTVQASARRPCASARKIQGGS